MSYIIGIDPATQYGLAVVRHDGTLIMSESRSINKFGLKWLGFMNAVRSIITEMSNVEPIDGVVIEEPISYGIKRAPNFTTPQLVGIAMAVCEDLNVSYVTANNSAVKKFATGKGNSKKIDLLVEARRRFPAAKVRDDNEADAILLALYGLTEVEW